MGAKKSNGTAAVRPQPNSKKTTFWAYFWWVFGGFLGAHHWYLNRDNQALVWFGTCGLFGIGWLRDLYRIPTYVAEANDRPEYLHWFKYQVRAFPRVSTKNFLKLCFISGERVKLKIFSYRS